MRIALDLQACQNGDDSSATDRSALAFARAMLRRMGQHDVVVVLNGALGRTAGLLRAELDDIIPQDRIAVWSAPKQVVGASPGSDWRMHAAELAREHFLATLDPDIVHAGDLLQGFRDDKVISVGLLESGPATAVTLHDLVPLVHAEDHLDDPAERRWYEWKLASLRRADLWFVPSEFCRREAMELLGLPAERIVNVATAASPAFRPLQLKNKAALRERFGLARPFILLPGGIRSDRSIENSARAFARIPAEARSGHQLAIIGDAEGARKIPARTIAEKAGLHPDDIAVVTPSSEQELAELHNLCSFAVISSPYEPSGQAALEAMKCGTAVLCSNTAGLSEVMDREDALFAPYSVDAIAETMYRALNDDGFRIDLGRYGLARSADFSWDESARRTVEALEAAGERHRAKKRHLPVRKARPRLAYVSPMPPEPTGIADFSSEFLPALSFHYEIDVIVEQAVMSDRFVSDNLRVRTAEWFSRNGGSFDRILYHVGNSPMHAHMFDLMRQWPGVIVLHDVYLGELVRWLQFEAGRPEAWTGELYRSHGYSALALAKQPTDEIAGRFPCTGTMIEEASGVIVHSGHAIELATRWYGADIAARWAKTTLARAMPRMASRKEARQRLGLDDDTFLICTFGRVGATKLLIPMLDAFDASRLAGDPGCRFVIVGNIDDDQHGRVLRKRMNQSPARDRISSTGHIPMDLYRDYLAAADVGLQLRATSRGESSASILDCMAYGLPTIVNAKGAAAEFPRDTVVMLPEEFGSADLVAAMEDLLQNREKRERIGAAAAEHVRRHHSPMRVAQLYRDAIERFAATSSASRLSGLAERILRLDNAPPPDSSDWRGIIRCIAANRRRERGPKQILVDVSELARNDIKTGIQRVCRGLLSSLMLNPPEGYRVEPVSFEEGELRYARTFGTRFVGVPLSTLANEVVDLYPGDVFIGMDLLLDDVTRRRDDFHRRMRDRGVRIHYVIYDLLPIQQPDWFLEIIDMEPWIKTIASVADGLVCISRTVAEQLAEMLPRMEIDRARPLCIGHFHLGADLDEVSEETISGENLPFPAGASSFLMVGTVEVRKGYDQALEAFEQLWADGLEVHLVIIGKKGWKVEELAERMQRHPEAGRRLHWLHHVSDNLLMKFYHKCSALLMTSRGEGFGLPLIEAAKCNQPIIARDLPVFREVTGKHATYFSGDDAASLAGAIRTWLAAREEGRVPTTADMPWLTWEQSAQALMKVLLDDGWDTIWTPSGKPGVRSDTAPPASGRDRKPGSVPPGDASRHIA